MSPDGSLLVLAEKDKKQTRLLRLTQIFVYRLPTVQQMIATLSDRQKQRPGKWASLASHLDRLEAQQGAGWTRQQQEPLGFRHGWAQILACRQRFVYILASIFDQQRKEHPAQSFQNRPPALHPRSQRRAI